MQVTPPTVPVNYLISNGTDAFAVFAGRTVANAKRRYGATSTEQDAVADAWHKVGIRPA
jgi:hypothetical protein